MSLAHARHVAAGGKQRKKAFVDGVQGALRLAGGMDLIPVEKLKVRKVGGAK